MHSNVTYFTDGLSMNSHLAESDSCTEAFAAERLEFFNNEMHFKDL